MPFIVDFFLILFIVMTFKGLRMYNDEILAAIENASFGKLLGRTALVICGLLFIQWQLFGPFGTAEFSGLSLGMYLIIIYEAIGLVAVLFFKDAYLSFMGKFSESMSFVPKIPVAAELVFFCYLFVKDLLILF